MAEILLGSERATLYADGSVDYECWVRGVGWCLDHAPSTAIRVLANTARLVALPELEPAGAEEVAKSA